MPPEVLSSTSTSKRVEVSKGFFAGLGITVIALVALYFGLVWLQLGVPTRSSIWAHGINQKKLQRAASIQGPKLLIVGGSGTLFGVQAELIESKLNFPTVNFGTHAGLGIAYMLHLTRKAAKPGDTIVLASEYNTFNFGIVRRDSVFVDYLFARDPEYLRSLAWRDQFEIAMMMSLPRLRKGVRNRFRMEPMYVPAGVIYDPAKLNAHGDQLGNDAANRPRKGDRRFVPEGTLAHRSLRNAPAFELISEFVHWAQNNNVRVLATYPNLLEHPLYHTPKARENLRELNGFYKSLGVPMIASFGESLLQPSMFFDTCYHMTREGAAVRTERLIPHLAAALNRERK